MHFQVLSVSNKSQPASLHEFFNPLLEMAGNCERCWVMIGEQLFQSLSGIKRGELWSPRSFLYLIMSERDWCSASKERVRIRALGLERNGEVYSPFQRELCALQPLNIFCGDELFNSSKMEEWRVRGVSLASGMHRLSPEQLHREKFPEYSSKYSKPNDTDNYFKTDLRSTLDFKHTRPHNEHWKQNVMLHILHIRAGF